MWEGGGSRKKKKRTPVVLERWFQAQRPSADRVTSGEEREISEDCPSGKESREEGKGEI